MANVKTSSFTVRIPCGIGANHCMLRHIGWEKCGHGLTSRPRETADVGFLNELLIMRPKINSNDFVVFRN